MAIHFQRELTLLRKLILTLGAAVEDAISNSVAALLAFDEEKARRVMAGDNEIDQLEIEVEEECLKILALHQPVAHDLRFIVSVLKMNNDLERIGDHTVNIAKRAKFLATQREKQPWPNEIERMAENVKSMVKQTLDALIASDSEMARRVFQSDDTVDSQKHQIIDELRQRMTEPHSFEETLVLLKMIDVPRHLERIADLATNIAEDVVYMTEGQIIRHKHEE